MDDNSAVWRHADLILDGLLDLPDDLRDAALAALTLTPAIRECVTHLLAAHRRATGVLDHPFYRCKTCERHGDE